MEHPAPVYPAPGGLGKVGKTLFEPLAQACANARTYRPATLLFIDKRVGQWAMPTKVRHRFWWEREPAMR